MGPKQGTPRRGVRRTKYFRIFRWPDPRWGLGGGKHKPKRWCPQRVRPTKIFRILHWPDPPLWEGRGGHGSKRGHSQRVRPTTEITFFRWHDLLWGVEGNGMSLKEGTRRELCRRIISELSVALTPCWEGVMSPPEGTCSELGPRRISEFAVGLHPLWGGVGHGPKRVDPLGVRPTEKIGILCWPDPLWGGEGGGTWAHKGGGWAGS